MRKEKQFLLDEIHSMIRDSKSFVMTSYEGLTAQGSNDLRQELGKAGGSLEIVHKRVFLKAAEEAGVALGDCKLDGHIAIVFMGEDPVEATKAVIEYGKESGSVKILGGHVDGQLVSSEQVTALSKLPSKDVMRAQFLGLLEAPMAQTLATMQALLTSVIYCLDNKSKQDAS